MKVASLTQAPKKALGSITTTNLGENLLVQGALFSAGAIGSEYLDSLLQGLISKIPIGLPISPSTLTQIVKMGLSLLGLAFLKNKFIQMVIFGVFAQGMLSVIRGLLGKVIPPKTAEAQTAVQITEITDFAKF